MLLAVNRAASTSAAVALPVPDQGAASLLGPEGARILAERLAPSSAGSSVEEIAGGLQESVSLGEAVERGWFNAAEQRQIEGRASRDDLESLGYSESEIEEILLEQLGRR